MTPPQILYKYREINQYTLSSLVNRSLWFSSPLNFNDPFDCQVSICEVEPTKGEFDKMITKQKELLSKKIKQIILLKESPKQFKNNSLTPEYRSEIERFGKYLKDEMRNTGVLSLSENFDSTTMWGHYSSSHTGICIGYKTNSLLPKNDINQITLKVNYNPSKKINFNLYELYSRYALTPDHSKCTEILDEIISTKTDDWCYEEEWRIIKKEKGNIHHGEDAFESVYFGLNCSIENKMTVRNILHDKPMCFYQMIRSKGQLAVEAMPMKKNSKYWHTLPK